MSLKNLALIIGFLAMPFVSSAVGTSRIGLPEQMSVGAFYGSGFGASAHYILSSDNSIDAAVSMEMGGDKDVHGWADYLWRNRNAFSLMDTQIGWYYGGGLKFRSVNNMDAAEAYRAGPRGVAGAIHEMTSWPLEVYGEGAFTQHFLGASKSEFDIALGVRYYF